MLPPDHLCLVSLFLDLDTLLATYRRLPAFGRELGARVAQIEYRLSLAYVRYHDRREHAWCREMARTVVIQVHKTRQLRNRVSAAITAPSSRAS